MRPVHDQSRGPSHRVTRRVRATEDFDSSAALNRVRRMRLGSAVVALSFTTVVVTAGCGSADSCVNGSGSVISQTLDLSGLTGVDFQAAGEVTVTLGSSQQVMVSGQENIVERLNTDVINGIWEIGFDECVQNISGLRIDITVPEFDSAELSGAGTIVAETDANEMDTTLSGAGTITVSGQSTRHNVSLSGAGTVEAFDLIGADVDVVLSGDGTVNVTANEELSVDLSGAGAVFYKGDPEPDILISGSGNVDDAN